VSRGSPASVSVLDLTDGSSSLRVAVMGREYPEMDDYWDGNWLNATIEAHASDRKVRYQASLRADEFDSLRTQLVRMTRGQADTAIFESTEEWLTIRLQRDGTTVVVSALCRSAVEQEGSIELALNLDDAILQELISRLTRLLARFPVLGTSGAG
jgi:hypothetical protein